MRHEIIEDTDWEKYEKYSNLRTDAVWEKAQMKKYYRWNMKIAKYVGTEKQYMIPHMINDSHDENRTLSPLLDRKEWIPYNSINPVSGTSDYQYCKQNPIDILN